MGSKFAGLTNHRMSSCRAAISGGQLQPTVNGHANTDVKNSVRAIQLTAASPAPEPRRGRVVREVQSPGQVSLAGTGDQCRKRLGSDVRW